MSVLPSCNRSHRSLTGAGVWCAVGCLGLMIGGCNEGPSTGPEASSYTQEGTVAGAPEPGAEVDPEVDSAAKPEAEPSRTPAAKAPSETRLVDKTFDDIKFDIEPDAPFSRDMLTDEIEKLVGQRIRIRGYIYPTYQRTGLRQFILVRDNQECCFGPGAALYDCIIVEMTPGNTASFSVKPVAVEGTFSIEEMLGPEGNHLAIFHLDGEKVE